MPSLITDIMIKLLKGLLFFFLSTQLFAEPNVVNATTLLTCKITATNQQYSCSVGRNGIAVNKIEGDGATPAGNFSILRLFYRADKLNAQERTVLETLQQRGFNVQPLTKEDAWCDDAHSPLYNQHIKLSTFNPDKLPSHENLWRDDDLYDIIAVLGYNDEPVILGKGSAIFMHVARQTPDGSYYPTAGCIALSKQDLLQALASFTSATQIIIPAEGNILLVLESKNFSCLIRAV